MFTHIRAVNFNAIKFCSLNCVDGRLLEVIYETLDIIDRHFFDLSVSVEIIRWPLQFSIEEFWNSYTSI